jgi:hypothetical protein
MIRSVLMLCCHLIDDYRWCSCYFWVVSLTSVVSLTKNKSKVVSLTTTNENRRQLYIFHDLHCIRLVPAHECRRPRSRAEYLVGFRHCRDHWVWWTNKMLSQTAEIGKHAQCKIISRLTGVILQLRKVIPLLPYVAQHGRILSVPLIKYRLSR